jgi:secreted trypsin-like serine protease
MRRIAALACCLVLASPAAAIVGGAPEAKDIPGVMIVGSRGTPCTGTLLARDLVLTAAHCTMPGADYKIVVFDARRQPLLRDVAQVRHHPQFSIKTFLAHRATADVALLKLARPMALAPAPIFDGAPKVAPGDTLTLAGFGVTRRGDGRSGGTLRAASLAVTGKPGNLQIRLFDPATRGERPGLGACTGDSGGPVFIQNAGRRLVIGVVSWSTGPKNSDGCGGLSGVTPLSLYRGWILDTAATLGSPIGR